MMPRLMSVSMTEQAVIERRKTVTRRKGSTGEARCRYRFEDRDNSAKGYEAALAAAFWRLLR